jgi:hypothetical protein
MQCNFNSKSIFKNENCEIYEYQHFNQIKRTEKPIAHFAILIQSEN